MKRSHRFCRSNKFTGFTGEKIFLLNQQKLTSFNFRTVHKCFKDKLREQLLKYNIINNGGPQHGTVISELTFYLETLRTLKAMPSEELLDETIDDIWIK